MYNNVHVHAFNLKLQLGSFCNKQCLTSSHSEYHYHAGLFGRGRNESIHRACLIWPRINDVGWCLMQHISK